MDEGVGSEEDTDREREEESGVMGVDKELS